MTFRTADPTYTYTRILASVKGKLHYFPLECDGKDIDMYMPLNDAVDWMREEHNINVCSVPDDSWMEWFYILDHPNSQMIYSEYYPDYYTAIAAGLNKACDIVNDKNTQPCLK
jgi:hypothetical protein